MPEAAADARRPVVAPWAIKIQPVTALNGPYKIQKTPPSASLVRAPYSPGPRDSPSLAPEVLGKLQASQVASAGAVRRGGPRAPQRGADLRRGEMQLGELGG